MELRERASERSESVWAAEWVRGLSRWRAWRQGLIATAFVLLVFLLFYAEENRRGPRAWDVFRRQLEIKGVQTDWHKLAPPLVADDDNFATTPFLAALFDFVPGTYTPRDLTAYNRAAGFAQTGPPYAEARRSTPIVPPMVQGRRIDLGESLKLLREARQGQNAKAREPAAEIPGERSAAAVVLLGELEEFRPVLDELRSASGRPQSRFKLNYAEGSSWAVPQPHLPVLTRVSRVLMWRGAAALETQNPQAAAEDVAFILTLAGTLRSEPFQRSVLAQTEMVDNAIQVVWEGLADHRWSASQLSDLEGSLEKADLAEVGSRLRFDRAAGDAVFEEVHKDPGIVNGWQLGPDFGGKTRGFMLRHMPRGWMFLEQITYHRLYDQLVLPAIDVESGRMRPHLIEQANQASLSVFGHRLLASLMIGSANFLCLKAALAQTDIRQAMLGCALERYHLANGRFPDQLNEAFPQGVPASTRDTITGQPMKYRRTAEDRFVLYSVGWDEKDDGGKVTLSSQNKAPDPSTGDWVWPPYP